ncbi:MAG: hypothetical protein OHK93_006840 [Ramalina farinacea]|uniref:Uncharacterized protein n=1 Tax=Ramalina farinacea TaxID=258253 RepID=A0AA43QJD5_9LECA|nr:hypothetical protein [Ramalina farinacea]
MIIQRVSAQIFTVLCVATLALLVTSAPTSTAPPLFNGSAAAASTANISTPSTPRFVIERAEFSTSAQVPAVGLLFLTAELMGYYAIMPFEQTILGAHQYTNADRDYPRASIAVGAHLPRNPRYPFRVKHALWGLWLCTVKWVLTDMDLKEGYCKLEVLAPTGSPIWVGSLVYRPVTDHSNQTATLVPDIDISTAASADTVLTSREQIPSNTQQQDITPVTLPLEYSSNNLSIVIGAYAIIATPLPGGQRIMSTRLLATVYEAIIDRAEKPRLAPLYPFYVYQSSENLMSIQYSPSPRADYSAVTAGIAGVPFAIRALGTEIGFVECDFRVNIELTGETVVLGRVLRTG